MQNPENPESDPRSHWDAIYSAAEPSRLSWHQQFPLESLELIEASCVGAESPIIDVGGGASSLADCLLLGGYGRITVLDCSAAALDHARRRLGSMAEEIRWRVGDVRSFRPGEKYMLWHDRAVFHFMVDASDRRKYLDTLDDCLEADGHVVLGTFALCGPSRCSGLEAMRYDEPLISELFAPRFRVVSTMLSRHETPSGQPQDFMFFYMRRASG